MFGRRINLQEIENLLLQQFDLCEVACAGVDDKLYIFLTDKDLLKKAAEYTSAKIKIHPSAVKVKYLEEIPKNSYGKIVYKELEKFYD